MCIRTKGVGLHRDGAFAEFIVIPGKNVWVHRTAIDPNIAAIFDPLGNAVHTALKFGVVGEDVLVTGCGPIGLMSIAVARHVGARFITATDVSPARLEMALAMGADAAVNVANDRVKDTQKSLGMREGFDVGFEMSGSPAALQTSDVLRDRIASIITEQFPASEWQAGFDAAASGGVGKVILDWTEI